jgi:hypothetical protein
MNLGHLDPGVIALHLGRLHPIETWLALGLAFGPFLLLAVVVAVRRRRAIAEEQTAAVTAPPEERA